MRVIVSFVVAAFAAAALSGGALAQAYYPPPPPGYYPPGYYPPPAGYYAPAPSYRGAPVPPRDVGSYGPGAAYDTSYGEDVEDYPPPPYSPSARGQAMGAPRPPAAVGGGDVTGAIGNPPGSANGGSAIAGLPPEDQPESGPVQELPQQFQRQLVGFVTSEPAGTIIIDTPHTYLYLILGNGRALRYGVGVGREGFTWTGTERVSRMSQWPDWHPPKEMIDRQPYLPRFMAGGEGNPLGARALYLGNTIYRIHGTNQPSTIGHFVSSGCIRLTNPDIEDLYSRVGVGTRVVVLPGSPEVSASAQGGTAIH